MVPVNHGSSSHRIGATVGDYLNSMVATAKMLGSALESMSEAELNKFRRDVSELTYHVDHWDHLFGDRISADIDATDQERDDREHVDS